MEQQKNIINKYFEDSKFSNIYFIEGPGSKDNDKYCKVYLRFESKEYFNSEIMKSTVNLSSDKLDVMTTLWQFSDPTTQDQLIEPIQEELVLLKNSSNYSRFYFESTKYEVEKQNVSNNGGLSQELFKPFKLDRLELLEDNNSELE